VDFSDSIDVADEMGVDGELIDATALVNCPWRSNIFPVSKLDGLPHFVPVLLCGDEGDSRVKMINVYECHLCRNVALQRWNLVVGCGGNWSKKIQEADYPKSVRRTM
jgi:hypothetical protein